jgi:hypothetical protein
LGNGNGYIGSILSISNSFKTIIWQEPLSNMDSNGACKYNSCRSHQPGQGGYSGNSIPYQLNITLPEPLWKFKQKIRYEKSLIYFDSKTLRVLQARKYL